jgi:hypothetical protein
MIVPNQTGEKKEDGNPFLTIRHQKVTAPKILDSADRKARRWRRRSVA